MRWTLLLTRAAGSGAGEGEVTVRTGQIHVQLSSHYCCLGLGRWGSFGQSHRSAEAAEEPTRAGAVHVGDACHTAVMDKVLCACICCSSAAFV